MQKDIDALTKQVQLADYLSAAQIFLKDNFLLERPLQQSDIKERLLGHWGTCPGINLVYATINRLIIKHEDKDFLYVVGPGHGFPAFQANLFIEGSLDADLSTMIRNFSTPYGYPSHLNPEAPGVILEGGELGYSLSVAAGSVLDNPKLVTVCLVGDGEAETGPLAASWNVNRFINPKTDGVVLPVLHLNGYKISGPTVFGRMSNDEISDFFRSHGYTPLFIDSEKEQSLAEQSLMVFGQAMQMIQTLKAQADTQEGLVAPRWPVIIMKTPKGIGAPIHVGDVPIAGHAGSHQIVFSDLKGDSETNTAQLKQLEDWLKSYNVQELLTHNTRGEESTTTFNEVIIANIPKGERRLGQSKYAHGKYRGDLELPADGMYSIALKERGEIGDDDAMRLAGKYMRTLFENNKERANFRLFSPDETYSNHLESVFSATARAWQWPIDAEDKDMAQDGRVVELLSEHTLFGMLLGYALTGRYGFFATYEAFAPIVASMAAQYIKFISVARNVSFREPLAPVTVILSSLLERQDHNGFSHQNPSFIAGLLNHSCEIVNVYFPADKNLMLESLDLSLTSNDTLNVIVSGKKMHRSWLTPEEARKEAEEGALVWDFLSSEGEPDVVVATCGDYVTEEAVIGVTLFRQKFPQVKLRFVNFFKLDMFSEYCAEPPSEGVEPQRGVEYYCHGLNKEEVYSKYLTQDKPIVFNFHGYPATIKKLLFDYGVSQRIIINGYEEEGSTTSPFDMKARNGLSRFHLVKDIAEMAAKSGVISNEEKIALHKEMNEKLQWEKDYIKEHKIDPPEITQWGGNTNS
jgi:xylulose-5-phosphate/fructose-6-phosphate phosphoketolase